MEDPAVVGRENRNPGAARTAIVVGLILAAAAVLRVWGLSGGLPLQLSVDEPEIMTRSLGMVKTGDFNPHFFEYPGLYLYLQAGVIVVRFLLGASAGYWTSLAQVTDFDFYLWGRAVTAAFGTATVFLVYRAGTRWGRIQALVAAGLLAVMPIHARESHFVLTDVPTAFFVVLALVLSLRALEKGTGWAFGWAGVAAGLAAGTKYTAWVAILLPVVAAVMATQPAEARLRHLLAACGGFFAAYLLVAPYTLLDLPGFLNGFGALAASVPPRSPHVERGSIVYYKHLRNAMGQPAMVLGWVGALLVAVRLVRGPRRAPGAMVLVFVPVFFSTLLGRSLVYARYLMPLLPFVCLLIAEGFAWSVVLIRRVARPRVLAAAFVVGLVAAVTVQPAITSVGFDRDMGREGTYALAYDWMQGHISPGARIAHEAAAFHPPPGRYREEYMRSLVHNPTDYLLGGTFDYVIASSAVYGKVFGYPTHYRADFLAYNYLFRHLVPVFTVPESPDHPGPEVRIFSVPR